MTTPTPQPLARDYSWRRTHDALPDISLIVWISAGGGTALLACHTGSEWVSATNDRTLPFVPIYWQHLRLPEWPDQPPAPTPNVSETPRTDAAIVESILCTEGGDEECTVYPCVEHVEADFARQLERELTAVTKERDELKEDNDYRRTEMGNVWEMVQKISPWQESNDMNWSDEISCGLNGIAEQLTAALARAEKAEEDTRRLDWVMENIQWHTPSTMYGEVREYRFRTPITTPTINIRKAIDAALTPTKEPAP